jgi:hypothetical protein
MHECGSTGTQVCVLVLRSTSMHGCKITPVTIATTEYIVAKIAFSDILSPNRLTLFGLV